MKPAPFSYFAPTTIEETVATLAQVAADDGRVLAGGQSLVPTMAFRLARPRHLVDINGVAELRHLAVEDGKLRIGAGIRHAAFHKPAAEGPLGRLLSAVVHHIAHSPIRARGTFCGSIAHADPAAEWGAVAAALSAQMVARSARGQRIIPAQEFFKGIMTTALKDDELLEEVRLPMLPSDARYGFCEFSRRAGDFGIAMAVVVLRMHDSLIAEARVAVGGAEAAPRRLAEAESALHGRAPSAGLIQSVAGMCATIVDPLDDENISADYRRGLVRTMVRRALEQATA